MANYSAKTIDEFIAGVPETAHAHIAAIRAAVSMALPRVQETISYGKPYYKQPKHLVGFDVYKNHINFEVYTGQLAAEHRAELEEKGYKTGNRSFQLRFDQKVPTILIGKLAKDQLARHSVKE